MLSASNICLTCNSGPKGLAWFVLSKATAQTMTTGIVRLKHLLGQISVDHFNVILNCITFMKSSNIFSSFNSNMQGLDLPILFVSINAFFVIS